MATERLIGNKEGIQEYSFWKELRLLSPGSAQKLGIPTESPVFVSPQVTGLEPPCSECKQSYQPLVYPPCRRIVEPHHFCRKSGGIYIFSWPPDFNPVYTVYGWVASVLPVGRITRENDHWRAESVLVERINAHCLFCRNADGLREGYIVGSQHGVLVPVCGCTEYYIGFEGIKFEFFIDNEGSIHFALPKKDDRH